MRTLSLILLLAASLLRTSYTQAQQRLTYGSEPAQFGDWQQPAGKGPFPLVVVLHGGCWLLGSANLDGTAPLAKALTAAGFATWNVEYRRLGEPGAGWPGTFLDVAQALDYVRVLARRFPVDTTRVLVIGHSAGGHLALWAAGRSRLPPNSELRTAGKPFRPRAAISLGGPTDLRPFVGKDQEICGQPVITRLLGTDPDGAPNRWHDASPAQLLPLGIPTRLIVGTQDPVVPAEAARSYESAARKAGDNARYVPITDADHFDVITPTSKAWDTVLANVRELLTKPPVKPVGKGKTKTGR